MPRREQTAFRIAPDILAALREIKAKEGLPIAVQVNFALKAWLEKRGYRAKADRKRAATRRRS